MGPIPLDDWTSATFGELVHQDRPICYGVLKPGEHDADGVPLIRIVDLDDGEVRTRGLHQISPELDEGFARSRLEGGEILLSIQGTIGRVALVPPGLRGANISRTIARIALAPGSSSEYVAQWMRSTLGQLAFDKAIVGTTRASLNIGELRKVRVPLPPLPEQRKIAAILSSVDDAIAATRKVIEQTKRVKQGLLQTLMTRGIGHTRFRQTEIGEIPEAWDVVRLGQLVHLQNGRGFRSSEWAERGTPIIKIGNLNGGDDFGYFDGDLEEKHVVRTGDLLFSWSGSRGTSFGPYLWRGPTGALNQHIFRVDLKSDRVSQQFLFQKLLHLTAAIEHSAHGGAGLVHVKKSDLVRYPLALPPLDEQGKIVKVLSRTDKLLASLETASRHLDLTRRGLMQDLLTGRVRVPLD